MRILFLTSEFPYPPFAGAPLRNFGLIEGVARQHEVWLLSFSSSLLRESASTPLHQVCRTVQIVPGPQRGLAERLRDLALSGQADLARRYVAPGFEAALRAWLTEQRFDAVQIENLEMAIYLPLIRELQPEARIVYDAHNAEYALQQRIYEAERRSVTHLPGALYSRIQADRVRAFERGVCAAVDAVVAVSDTDADLLRALGSGTPVTVVPNGIATALYETPAPEPIELTGPALVFTGKMDYRPNVDAALWFAAEILPQIRDSLPLAHFYVVGQSPHPRLDVLRGQAGVTLTGFVPEIAPYLQAASVFVVPLRMGSGTRLKVLEAMASGCPIVSTRTGAQGLHGVDGHDLLLADTTREFALAVIRLCREPDIAATLGQHAREFVRANYDWALLLPRLLAVYEELGLG